jgi:diacylglycerol O-acyltransferase / wax synthase
MQRLSGLESLFLNLESPRWPMHGAGIAILDPTTAPDGFSFATLRRTLEERVHLLAPLRRRLVEVPLGLAQPYWVEDPDFDLASHLHRVAVPAPGGSRELAELVTELAERPLDRRQPLWEMWYVEGLEQGHVAIIEKLHHASIDGMAGMELLASIFDPTPHPKPVAPPREPWRPERVPSAAEVVVHSLPEILATPLRVARGAWKITGGLRRGRRQQHRETERAGRTFHAPRVSLNESVIGRPHKAVAYVTVSMEDVNVVRKAFGTTVNDVALALCAGALRGYFESRGELPAEPLMACVPVNVREEGEEVASGVKVSLMFTSLETHLADPVERLRAIHTRTDATKHVHGARGADVVETLVSLPAPVVWRSLGYLLESLHAGDRLPPIFNGCISNIAGPRERVYFAGAELLHHFVMAMLFEGVGLFIPLISYAQQIDFSITTVREQVPDPWTIADGIADGLAELVKAARELTEESAS